MQHALRKEGFTLMRTSNPINTQFIPYLTESLIAQNRALVLRVLARTKKNLEDIEMEHRNIFKGEKLVSCLPPQLGYYFEKCTLRFITRHTAIIQWANSA